MPTISSLTAMTELQAVNKMLAAIGEAPISDLGSATSADVVLATNIIRDVAVEVQGMGWKFNTEFGYEIAPDDTFDWEGSDDTTATLNIFLPPSNLLKFDLSAANTGPFIDTVVRKSRQYQAGSPLANVLVFYDRIKNRDGFEDRDFLYINPCWLFDFEDCPQSIKQYITTRAMRQFAEKAVGSAELSGYTEKDEARGLREAKRDQALEDRYNVFNNAEVLRHMGGRPRGPIGMYDNRRSPGPA